MHVKRLYTRIETYFDNKEMYQILLKVNNQTELTEEERKELDYWILAYEHRDELFKKLKMVIELQNEVSTVSDHEIINVCRKIKANVPKRYTNIQAGSNYLQKRSALLTGLKMFE